jgi:DNA-binding transcriptional regulator YhcF (GntR family)
MVHYDTRPMPAQPSICGPPVDRPDRWTVRRTATVPLGHDTWDDQRSMKFSVDRDLPVPLGVQLRGLIEYGIACGELLPGARLPSVRELADELGVAPMTVSLVYRELKDGGLIEARTGLGTFVSDNGAPAVDLDPRLAALQRRLDGVIEDALALGLGAGELATMIAARFSRRSEARGPTRRIVMVGLFADATRGYARALAERLDGLASIVPTTVDALDQAEGRALCESADLVVTFANQRRAVAARLPKTHVTTISFIPSEETRRALAGIDPLARLGVISLVPEFLSIMKRGVHRFAPHVRSVRAAVVGTETLDEVLSWSDVVVIATGAESTAQRLGAGQRAIAYRHIPDPGDVDRLAGALLGDDDSFEQAPMAGSSS